VPRAWIAAGLVACATARAAEPQDPYEVRDNPESVLASDTATSSELTLGAPFVRSATGWLLPGMTDNLPEFRVTLDASMPDSSGTLGGIESRVKGVEVLVPRTDILWLGWEKPEEEGELPRATFSIRNKF
jgi:hypothetical protein